MCTCDCGHQHDRVSKPELYWRNITHNLGAMAAAAGIYEPLWRPDECGITTAKQLIAPLQAGLDKLKADPEGFAKFNASNAWGVYNDFVPFVEEYLDACKLHPEATVSVSR